jgi:hypothetical protein
VRFGHALALITRADDRNIMNITSPKVLLRVEGFVICAAAVTVYANLPYSWITFALLILAPDLSMLGFLVGKKTGTICYNLFHTYTVPILIFMPLLMFGYMDYVGLPLIWIAHIAFDRLLGYGIKYETAFKDTHLQRV